MKIREEKGISMITIAVTIVLIIILSVVAINGSLNLIDRSANAKNDAKENEDNDTIRALLTYSLTDPNKRFGLPLSDTLVITISGEEGEEDKEYGLGYYLVPGGSEKTIEKISQEIEPEEVHPYKNLSAAYIVDYDNGTFVRLDEFEIKGE